MKHKSQSLALAVLFVSISHLAEAAESVGRGEVGVPTSTYVIVAFGIKLPQGDSNGNIVRDETGRVVMQSLEFKFQNKLNLIEATKEADRICSAYIDWVNSGKEASPRVTTMSVFVLLVSTQEDGGIELLDLIDFPRTQIPFDTAYDPFSSTQDCAEKIGPALQKLSQQL